MELLLLANLLFSKFSIMSMYYFYNYKIQTLKWKKKKKGNGYPLQYSCLGNPKDRGGWQAVFHGVSKKLDIKRPILSLFCSLHYETEIRFTVLQNIWLSYSVFIVCFYSQAFLVAQLVKNLPVMQTWGSIPGWGRFPGEEISYPLQYSWASLLDQMVKNLPAMWETWLQSLHWEDSLGNGITTHSSSCLENSHGQRSLVGYSSWGRKEWEVTERLNTA